MQDIKLGICKAVIGPARKCGTVDIDLDGLAAVEEVLTALYMAAKALELPIKYQFPDGRQELHCQAAIKYWERILQQSRKDGGWR